MQARPLLWSLTALLLGACASTPSAYDQPADRIKAEMASAASAVAASKPVDQSNQLYPALKLDLPAAAQRVVEPRFDLVVNNSPARQVLLGIVADTRYSMLLPNDLDGQITVNLKSVTVPEALSALKQLYGYEYHIEGSRIFVEAQKLQTRVLKVNYLNASRKGSSDIRVTSGAISDSTTSTSSSGTTSGSTQTSLVTSKVSTTVQSDFWGELSQALKMILGEGEGRNIVVSPQSGVIVVRAMPAEIAQIEAFLKASQLAIERQVIIEAKIMEVTLSNDFQAGINWAAFSGSKISAGTLDTSTTISRTGSFGTASISGTAGTDISNTASGTLFGMILRTGNFAAALNLLEEQGKVHVLSSPRIATLNNQKAVLKVGSDDFFVTGIDTTTTSTSSGTTTTPKITLQPFFSGISLDVTPQINDRDQITLHVHPMISEVTTATQKVALGDSTYSLPTASSKISEMDSIVKAQDGQMVALGGLIRQRASTTDSQVPWLGGIPLIGNLFKQKSQEMEKRELVILLKPTIVQTGNEWSEEVRDANQRMNRLLDTDNARLFGGESSQK